MKKIIALAICSLSFSAIADSQYQRDKQFCMSDRAYQSQADCLREAGAALQERRQHVRYNENYSDNKYRRCEELNESDEQMCRARLSDSATTSGSVESGGIIRQVEVFVREDPYYRY